MRELRRKGAGALVMVWALALVLGTVVPAPAQTKPEGEMRFAFYVTLAPAWFDPGEVTGFITPFFLMWAMHDALVKTMPGKPMAPSLAESWAASADQKTYDFKLREGLKFHNGDPFTAEGVKFSFERAKGYKILKDKVRAIEIVSPSRVKFHLHYPNGFDAGELHPFPPYFGLGEAVGGYLQSVGIRTKIRTKIRTMERAAFMSEWNAKKLHGVCLCITGVHGNAATRLSQYVPSDGAYAYGGWPDVDALFKQQARETDRKKRAALRYQIQATIAERVRFAMIFDYIWPSGIGPRVAEPALLLIDPYPWAAPYEELKPRNKNS